MLVGNFGHLTAGWLQKLRHLLKSSEATTCFFLRANPHICLFVVAWWYCEPFHYVVSRTVKANWFIPRHFERSCDKATIMTTFVNIQNGSAVAPGLSYWVIFSLSPSISFWCHLLIFSNQNHNISLSNEAKVKFCFSFCSFTSDKFLSRWCGKKQFFWQVKVLPQFIRLFSPAQMTRSRPEKLPADRNMLWQENNLLLINKSCSLSLISFVTLQHS